MLAGDALRMELDAVDRQRIVAQALDGSVLGAGVGDEAVRQAVGRQRQRMVAGRGERRGEAGEEAAPVMGDEARVQRAGWREAAR